MSDEAPNEGTETPLSTGAEESAAEPPPEKPATKGEKETSGTKKKRKAAAKSEPADNSSLRLFAIFVLSFITGAFAAHVRMFPYEPFLDSAFQSLNDAAIVLKAQFPALTPNAQLNHWGRARTDQTGVTIHKPGEAYEGYTLYSSGHTRGAFLIDMEGNVVHEWKLDFAEAFPDRSHVLAYREERLVFWEWVHMFPNGDVIAKYYGTLDTPYGYGLIKVDKDSKLIWNVERNIHHYFDVAPDGSIWTLDHAFRDTAKEPIKGVTHLPPTVLEDFIVHISPDGEVLQEINVYDALVNSPFHHIATLQKPDYPGDTDWDPLHTNAVRVIGPEFASHHDYVEPGYLLISMRRPDALMILDPATEKVVWANRGFHSHQHDPDPLPNGNVMVYDNRGHIGDNGTSRLIEFHPSTNAVAWMYAGTAEQPFESEIRGNQQVLPNDNVISLEHKTGRIFEVTREGEIVWEFHNPVREGARVVPGVSCVVRYAPDYMQFTPQKGK